MEKGSIVLTLENIGMLKKAQVDIGGLSVIAGANDEGKSTVGKALMALIKANHSRSKKEHSKRFDFFANLIFQYQIAGKGKIGLKINSQESCHAEIADNRCIKFNTVNCQFVDCTLIQTPLIWDLYDFFFNLTNIESNSDYTLDDFKIPYPYILKDLYAKLVGEKNFPIDKKIQQIAKDIENIICGDFVQKRGSYVFRKKIDFEKKKTIDILLANTATGIKNFGILQALIKNHCVTPRGFFIFDEPENHLHATWQGKFAEILARLVQNHVCIMVNTHSPYMLEALHKYGKKYAINTNFYLADSGKVEQIDNDNSATLEKIYKKLNQSFISLDEILDEEEE